MNFKILAVLIFGLLLIGEGLYSQNETIEFDTANWILSDNAEIIEFDGRTVLTGSAYMRNVEFLNGTIEVDLMTTGERNFGGFMFRVQSFREYEWCWLRMHKTNGEIQDGIQYAPVFNGTACWQLNGGKGGISPVNVPKNEWVHMKIEILNETAKLYVKDMATPVMVMDNLQLGLKKGSVGLRANLNTGIYFSDFSYKTEKNSKTDMPEEKAAPSNILTKWELSPAYKIKDFSETANYPAQKLADIEDWIIPDVEISGLVNITKYLVHQGELPDCAILRTYINSEEDKLVKMNFGYSDAVTIFLNQQPVFWGNSAYRSRNMAFGGWISYNDAVYLNLKKGRNELLMVVAEVFGGWGFQGKLE
jgi:hypothetical protein